MIRPIPLPVVLFLNKEGGTLGSHSPKIAPGWMPGRPSLAVNKPDLEALSGSGVPLPGVTYLGSPGGLRLLGNELAFESYPGARRWRM